MAYCPECGSEVAPNDVFCAYCGIALPKVALPTEDSNSTDFNVSESSLSVQNPSPEMPIDEVAPIITKDADDLNLPVSESSPLSEPNVSIQDADTEEEILPESDTIPSPELFENDDVEDAPDVPETIAKIGSNGEELQNPISDQLVEAETTEGDESINPVETDTPTVNEDDNLTDEVESALEEISEPVDKADESDTDPSEKKPEIDLDPGTADSAMPPTPEDAAVGNAESPSIKIEEETAAESIQSANDGGDMSSMEPDEPEDGAQTGDQVAEDNGTISGSKVLDSAPVSIQEELSKPAKEQAFLPNANVPPEIDRDSHKEERLLENQPPADHDVPRVTDSVKSEYEVKEVVQDDSVDEKGVEVEKNEGRSFTNPIAEGADTGNRNKTKLKPLDEGTILSGRYEIVRKIGGGGMGAVYLATDKNLGGVLRAVKEMVQSYIEDDQQDKAISDFKRESLLLTSLDHPAIPTIYDYFFDESENRFYLVMKYISGGDLAARLRAAPDGKIDEVSVTNWAIQVADVLDYLHSRQPPIVYRDLKPSNIMIDGNTNRVMLIDFGIARWVTSKEEKGVTAVGTMGYAPPELFSGNVEPRSDIYSLGSTMFHLLTGADPQSNPLLIFDFNKNPRPRQINPQLSDQMEQILMRAVEYNSINRFGSASEMREELVKHMDNLKSGTVTFGVVNPAIGYQKSGNVPVFCGFCGQKILSTDVFCPFCGSQQPIAAESQNLAGQKPPSYSAPSIFPKLVIVGTSELDSTDFSLEKESNLVGRRDPMSNIFPEVDLSKFDPQTKISRRHARIWREGDAYMLEDLGSSNGTTVISTVSGAIRLLPRQPQVLSHGDKVKLGDTILRFTIG